MAKLNLDLKGKKSMDEVGVGGSVAPGFYHVELEKTKEDTNKNDNAFINMSWRILAGTVTSEVGKLMHDKLFLTEKSIPRQEFVAKRLGLLAENQLGSEVDIDLDSAIGRQLIIEVIPQKDQTTGELSTQYSQVAMYGLYSLADPKVATCPRSAKVTGSAKATVPLPADLLDL